jgi:hypothetical protein
MSDAEVTTIGTCFLCKRTFAYKPGRVFTFKHDPETNLPLGMTVAATWREPSPEAVARAEERVVCPNCVDKAKRLWDGKQRWEGRDMSAWRRPDR